MDTTTDTGTRAACVGLTEPMGAALRYLRSPITAACMASDRMLLAYGLLADVQVGGRPRPHDVALARGRFSLCQWEGRDHEGGAWALVFDAIGVEP